tara:strand:+ start:144 stop:1832 length:1689 start_codon:yes stop_codon:yes gene_type:complete
MKEVKFQGFQEFLNERLKPVTKRDWKKANSDQRIDWLLQAYDDSDEAEKYEFTDFKDLPDEATANMYLESTVTEVKRSMISGNSGRTVSSLEDRKYELKKEVKGARIGDYIAILPKGTIIYNLAGGVYASHKSLKGKYDARENEFGYQVRSMPETLADIEKNGKVLESAVNEGQFSWMTHDTGNQIGSEKENTINVTMFDDKGNKWEEKRYDGYGEFGGMDYYTLLAKMNGIENADRGDGLDIAFNKKKVKGKVLFPALVENPKRFNFKKHDFTVAPEDDENQSWYQEEEGYDESVITEAKGFKNTTDFEKFLIEIDGMPDLQIKKIMGKDYIDTPGFYQDEKGDYDDVEDFMRSNMGTSEFEKLESWWENNVAESVITEGSMSDIHMFANDAKDINDFIKIFFKEFGDKIKKTADTIKFAKELYADMIDESAITDLVANNEILDLVDRIHAIIKELKKDPSKDSRKTSKLFNDAKPLISKLHGLMESVVTEGAVEPQIKKIAELIGETPKKVEAYVSSRGLNITSVLQHVRDNKEDAPKELRAAIKGDKSSDDLFIFLHKA